jgi:alkylhydroperoxidase family enzyme
MTTPRITPLPITALRPEWEATMARIPGKGLKGENAPVNVVGTLMHAPNTLGTFLEYWVTAKQVMSLSVREQELVILRMGVLYDSEYVWRHHVPVAEEFGVTAAEMDGVLAAAYDVFASSRERALLVLTDEIVERRTIGDAAWEAYGSQLPTDMMLELIGLVSQYVLFAVTNNVYRVALEAPMLPIRGLH